MTPLKISELKPEYDSELQAYVARLNITVHSSMIPQDASKEAHELAMEQCRMMLREQMWSPLVHPIGTLQRLALSAQSGHDVTRIMKEISKATDGFIDL